MNWLQKTAMFAHGEGDYVIAYKSHVFLIDPTTQDTNDPIVRQMANFLGTSTRDLVGKFSDTWEYLSHLSDMRPDILQGQINDSALLLQVGDFQQGAGSRLLQNVLKTLGLSYVEYQNESDSENRLDNWQATGNLPEYLFHGTTSQHADRILRFGLQPGESTTNFPGRSPHSDISHDDTVFLVESIDMAMFYATNAVSEKHGFPVIFRFKIPDPNLLVSDFDVEVMADQPEGNVYENTYKAPQDDISTRIHEDPFDFSKKIGKFGYRGRLPANFIVDIMIRPENDSEIYGYSESEWVSVTSQQLSTALEIGDPMSYDYEDYEDEEEEYMEPQEMPRRHASNWLTKQCANVATSDMLDHAAKAITMTLPGSWEIIESRPNLKKTYDYQQYGTMSLYGNDIYQPGDEFIVKFFGFVKQSPSKMPDELFYLEDQAQQWLEQNHVPVNEFDSASGHNMVYYHARVQGFIPGRNAENQPGQNQSRSPWPAKNPMHELGNTRGEHSEPIYTPFDLAEWVDTTIKRGYQDFGGGDNGPDDDPNMLPDWPYGEDEYTKEETTEDMMSLRNPRIRGNRMV